MRGMKTAALCCLLLAAHLLRWGWLAPAALVLAAPLLMPVRLLQGLLWLGCLEWLRMAWVLAAARSAEGEPFGRMLAILVGVAAFTAWAALRLRRR